MLKTYGLTHIALKVKDVQRAANFYKQVFGAQEMYSTDKFIQVQTPGSHDIIVFEQASTVQIKTGSIIHFGFRLVEMDDINKVIDVVIKAGGSIKEKGEFCPGEPYVFVNDPDGYEIEIWYELQLEPFN